MKQKQQLSIFKHNLEHQKDLIYETIRCGHFKIARDELLMFRGANLYAWQCDILTHEEWKENHEWYWITMEQVEQIIAEEA